MINTHNMNNGKERLVVEVVGAHNLMPKDGEGSSSAFVEVEFENQKQRTQVKNRDLNPVWNQKLVFHVNDVLDLPYRTIEVNVFNEKKSNNTRNFLGKVRLSGSAIAKEGEAIPQLYTLDKRSLFSHVRGELSLKIYLSSKENGNNGGSNSNSNLSSNLSSKKIKKLQNQQQGNIMQVQQHQNPKENNANHQNQHNNAKPSEKNEPVVITTAPTPVAGAGMHAGVHAGGMVGGDYSLKETNPHLGGGSLSKDKTSSTYDLVEQVQYLYVRVVKARGISGYAGGEVVAEVKLGNYRGITKRVGFNNAEWDQVFAYSKDCIQSSVVEIFVKERDKEDYFGKVWFDLSEIPRRVPPDSQLAPQWYRMEDRKGDRIKGGEVMAAIWFGTQADEAFGEAWHSKAANVHSDSLCSIKSKVYLSPKLWYLKISVIEAQDVIFGEKSMSMMRYPELLTKAQVGNQVLRTRVATATGNRNLNNPLWNDDLIFVVAEPFEDYVLVSLEDRVSPGREETIGRVMIPVALIEKRLDEKPVASRWFNLDFNVNSNPNDQMKSTARFASRIHLRVSLEGGYHVLDEATLYCSDVRPTEKQLWKPNVGVLEMGILSATNLMPMKLKEGKGGSVDAYCVAKYGQKWVRTRTVVDNLSPKWNEQYTWEVFDPCTVITIGVFDNSRVDKNGGMRDSRIGKVRIRLSTLQSDKVYTHSYPLLMLHPSGVKKMGELHLAIRFSCANMMNVLQMYAMPLLPKMHYIQPLNVTQLDSLRYQAVNVVVARLSRAEPPLSRDVVEYMLDYDSHMWSMRKSRANFFRVTEVLSWFLTINRHLSMVITWQKPVISTMTLIGFLTAVFAPELVIPAVLLTLALTGMWRYRGRQIHPPHMDTKLSFAETASLDDLDEEFDSFPTSRSADIVRMRYDRLRHVAGRIQTVVADMATQGERAHALLSWRDPRATFVFVICCIVTAIVFYVVPFRWIVGASGVYLLRPPRFRSKLPSSAVCFFKRLPTKADTMF